MITGIIILTILVSLTYALLIGRFIKGWDSIPAYVPGSAFPDVMVSLVIPFRNEAGILERSLAAITDQDYPASYLEVLYVNDHSDDGSVEIVERLIKGHDNFRLLHCSDMSYGKKAALAEGAMMAKGELLLFTDADCFPGKQWITAMAGFYREKEPVMISGPLLFKNNRGLFSRLQALELISLTGSGAGSFGAGDPVLCTGANMGFRREVYIQSLENIHTQVPSGDDIFMMLYMKKAFPGKVYFIKAFSALVFSEPLDSITSFFRQRIRWASKARYYKDFYIIFIGVIVLIMNMIIAGLLFAAFFNKFFLYLYGGAVLTKSVVDFILLARVSNFFGQQELLGLFLPAQLLYPFYSIFSVIGGLCKGLAWKGRKLNTLFNAPSPK